jgi:S-adenosylmethionine:tRNA-ribosyltransferase-isomerase (queuine synthetase)
MTDDQQNSGIPAEELAALEAMANLSDDTLWVAAREQMPAEVQARMSVLMTKNNFGTITDEEYAELAAYVEEGDKLMLRKSYAMKHLMDRGYKVTFDDLEPID